MTDTVNARERVEAFLNEWARRGATAGNGDILYSLGMSDGTLDLTMTDVRAMLAAAPKAEPVELTPSVYRLLQLADCALANVTAFEADARLIMGNTNYAITDNARSEIRQFLLATPEAPKVEPVAWLVGGGASPIMARNAEWVTWMRDVHGASVIPLYPHPAPASELLKALREVTPELSAEFANIDGPWCRGQISLEEVWEALINTQIDAIAILKAKSHEADS